MKSTFWMTAQETEDYLKSIEIPQTSNYPCSKPGYLATKIAKFDPFQDHKPLFMLEPLFMHDLKRLMDRPICDCCGRPECRGCVYPLT